MSPATVAEAGEPLVDLLVEEPGWDSVPGFAAAAETGARLALEVTGHEPACWQIAVLACSDARIAALNADFRARESATDVLSWPAFDGGPPADLAAPHGARMPLGDIAIALGTTRKDAVARGLDLKDHVIHLILHSVLHLLGHDHSDESGAALMEDLEVRALARIGLPDPYEFARGRDRNERGDAQPAHSDR